MNNQISTQNPRHLDITLVVKGKHAALWRAANKLGSQHALAVELGLTDGTVGSWINLKGRPSKALQQKLEPKLLALTGQLCDELFPEEIYTPEFLENTKSVEFDRKYVREHAISFVGMESEPNGIPEAREALDGCMKSLTHREREIIKLRYGLGDGYTYTLEEVGAVFKLSRERIRAIEAKAIRKMQQPSRMLQLVDCVPESWVE